MYISVISVCPPQASVSEGFFAGCCQIYHQIKSWITRGTESKLKKCTPAKKIKILLHCLEIYWGLGMKTENFEQAYNVLKW